MTIEWWMKDAGNGRGCTERQEMTVGGGNGNQVPPPSQVFHSVPVSLLHAPPSNHKQSFASVAWGAYAAPGNAFFASPDTLGPLLLHFAPVLEVQRSVWHLFPVLPPAFSDAV